ncbi:MAG: tRNA (N6-threonylcarbamoyladenosine(37)-N6)-methyltransferase TrmO [Bacteroidota bacterium]
MNFELKQIGTIHTPYKDNAPYQADEKVEGDFTIDVDPKFEQALKSLEQFTHIYVLYYLDRLDEEYKNIISPPWADNHSTGLFASRSPVRPNPIGLSIVKILNIKKNIISISGIDAFDNTPLIDIKPYIKNLDCKEDANAGWINFIEFDEHLKMHLAGIPHKH